jgi:hypothetical protein
MVKSMLVLCHPRSIETHWLYEDEILPTINENKIELVKTVDILPGGDIEADAFSDKFINDNEGKWDIVYVPDCGGKWCKYQILKDQIRTIYRNEYGIEGKVDIFYNFSDQYEHFKGLILKLYRLVKPGGYLHFSKVGFISDTKIFVDLLKEDLRITQEDMSFKGDKLLAFKYYKPIQEYGGSHNNIILYVFIIFAVIMLLCLLDKLKKNKQIMYKYPNYTYLNILY